MVLRACSRAPSEGLGKAQLLRSLAQLVYVALGLSEVAGSERLAQAQQGIEDARGLLRIGVAPHQHRGRRRRWWRQYCAVMGVLTGANRPGGSTTLAEKAALAAGFAVRAAIMSLAVVAPGAIWKVDVPAVGL